MRVGRDGVIPSDIVDSIISREILRLNLAHKMATLARPQNVCSTNLVKIMLR